MNGGIKRCRQRSVTRQSGIVRRQVQCKGAFLHVLHHNLCDNNRNRRPHGYFKQLFVVFTVVLKVTVDVRQRFSIKSMIFSVDVCINGLGQLQFKAN